MRMMIIVPAILTAVLAVAPKEAAADRKWTSIATGCVPVDEDVAVDNYDSRGGGVGFKGTATGDIRLDCPITINVPSASAPTITAIKMSYKDPDGTGTAARIRAFLVEVADGSNTGVTKCTVDSNNSPTTGFTTLACGMLPALSLSLTKTYWVQLYIERTSSSQDPEIVSVWVE